MNADDIDVYVFLKLIEKGNFKLMTDSQALDLWGRSACRGQGNLYAKVEEFDLVLDFEGYWHVMYHSDDYENQIWLTFRFNSDTDYWEREDISYG